jgi:hypothetical protein
MTTINVRKIVGRRRGGSSLSRKGYGVQMRENTPSQALNLRIGEVVEVRSQREILATLDENGELEALPFMPEMLQFCGQRFKVYKLAIKLCDTINHTGMHRMHNAVHLEGVRCDGQAHGGCQAGCLIYWKEAWLKRVDIDKQQSVRHTQIPTVPAYQDRPKSKSLCTLERLIEATLKDEHRSSSNGQRFSCQATELMRAAPIRIPWWDVRQYVLDVRSGNAGMFSMFRSVCIMLLNKFQGFSRRYLPRPLRFRGAKKFPLIEGELKKTPQETLNLQPGELIKVKTREEILQTLDKNGKNRGLSFDPEMLRYCGRQARVLKRVDKIIDEKTGRMIHLKNPCIILADVICCGDYNQYCPRSIYPYWRELWLTRVE